MPRKKTNIYILTNAFKENFTKKDMTIGFNSKYVKPDYLESVFLPKHDGWKMENEDVDGDGYPDVSIFDDENRLRVFNGYYFNDDTEKDKLRTHLMANKNNTYKTYLDWKFDEKNKAREAKGLQPLVRGGNKAHKDHVKNFVKWIHNQLKPIVKTLSKHEQMMFEYAGFDSKISSAVERYLVLPFILHKLNQFKVQTIHDIIFANDKKSSPYKLRMAILRSKEIKELYKNNVKYIENSIDAIMKNLANNFQTNNNGKIETNVNYIVEFIKSFMAGDWKIPNEFYNYAMSV